MKVLFVDDYTPRYKDFQKIYPDSTFVSSAKAAIDHMTKSVYDEVWLDYNYKTHNKTDEDPGNGMDVVKWIVDNPQIVPKSTRFVVHSLHYEKPLKMVRLLKEAGYSVKRIMFGSWLLTQKDPSEE